MGLLSRRSPGSVAADIFIVYSPIIILCISIFYPFYYMLINSFNGDLNKYWEFIWPRDFTLHNYGLVFEDKTLGRAFFITFARSATGIVLTVINSAMCAYALRKKEVPLRNFFLILFTIPMFFGGGIIPDYMIYRAYGLLDSFWVYILPRLVQFFFIIILMSYFRSLPDSLEDSAWIDGAGHFRIFLRIYLPLSLPVIAVIALFSGVYHWQSWFETIFFTRSPKLTTLSAVLMKLIRASENIGSDAGISNILDEGEVMQKKTTGEGVKLATMFVAMFPILCIYPFLQRYFVKGLMIGSVKG